MKIHNIGNTSYSNIYSLNTTHLKSKSEKKESDIKVEKDNKNSYKKNVAGSSKDSDENLDKKESNEEKDVITSKIVINPNGMKTLLMLRNSKVFSSLKIGETKNPMEEENKDIKNTDGLEKNLSSNLESMILSFEKSE